ncbi:hypothetical protein G7075_00550 [Phycicoccus sp. HDW14]|uniref:hypothetical protein n=1 Tax=Phycicoccus sp. HDW14 TaxID=2714941 RepID=UPI001408FB4B|nr:hypothetical protein [Phycicoccus sp. HDW14]QIM19973.1 hypothetical protein G7075_00550 [Phycicoccus sp. HDW14]
MSRTPARTRGRRRVVVGLTLALLAAVPAVRIATGAAADPPGASADVPSRVEAAPRPPPRDRRAPRSPRGP